MSLTLFKFQFAVRFFCVCSHFQTFDRVNISIEKISTLHLLLSHIPLINPAFLSPFGSSSFFHSLSFIFIFPYFACFTAWMMRLIVVMIIIIISTFEYLFRSVIRILAWYHHNLNMIHFKMTSRALSMTSFGPLNSRFYFLSSVYFVIVSFSFFNFFLYTQRYTLHLATLSFPFDLCSNSICLSVDHFIDHSPSELLASTFNVFVFHFQRSASVRLPTLFHIWPPLRLPFDHTFQISSFSSSSNNTCHHFSLATRFAKLIALTLTLFETLIGCLVLSFNWSPFNTFRSSRYPWLIIIIHLVVIHVFFVWKKMMIMSRTVADNCFSFQFQTMDFTLYDH